MIAALGPARLLALATLCLTLSASPVRAAGEPGTASGSFQHSFFDNRNASFRHAVAIRTTMVEDGETAPVVRILLSDNPVSVDELKGSPRFPRFMDAVQKGQLEGAIIDYVPGKADGTRIATLTTDPEGQMSGYQSHSETSDGPFAWQQIAIDGDVISGAMKKGEYDFRFAARIVDDPVTEQVRGAAAAAHPLSGVWSQNVNAILGGNADLAKTYLSKRAAADPARQEPGYWPQLIKSYQANRTTMLKAAKFTLIVVRGARATAVSVPAPGVTMMAEFVLEDGVWKVEG